MGRQSHSKVTDAVHYHLAIPRITSPVNSVLRLRWGVVPKIEYEQVGVLGPSFGEEPVVPAALSVPNHSSGREEGK